MPILIKNPTVIEASGNKPKEIRQYIGRVNSKTEAVSIARMKSPGGWLEPGQQPEFDEYTIVLRGMLRVTTKEGTLDVHEGEAVIVNGGEWVQCSTPEPEGAEYVAVLPQLSHTLLGVAVGVLAVSLGTSNKGDGKEYKK